ncbi:hypothetical protein HIM_05378 [Hirsutella minnesotensis 3608]|uniref:Uncharacterized protein n=1 Tax=Hirsutella minnesotensis 3608 TaxID=1043627 RepID=A0A0F8A5E4_9HYPO|nr:hypothetical protein HIM_05378 [Hirsutella minnesotensis 3608]
MLMFTATPARSFTYDILIGMIVPMSQIAVNSPLHARFITTPLLLLDILLTADLPWPTILYTILLDEIMIITGLVGALVKSSYKWGYFAFGSAAFLAVVWNLVFTGRKHANFLGSDIGRGGNVIHPDPEVVFYGVLDILAKPVFGAILLFGHRNIAPARLGLHIRDYDVLPANGVNKTDNHQGTAATTGTATEATA